MDIKELLINLKEIIFLYLFYFASFDLEFMKEINIIFDLIINDNSFSLGNDGVGEQ